MGAPVAAATVLAQSRTVRKALIGVLIALLTVSALVLTPLIAIPFATLGSAVAADRPYQGDVPMASGEWAYPLAGGYSKGRGFGYNPVAGCSYCSTDHQGYDMAQGCGSTIFAAGPGRVITAGAYQGYGNTVRVDHGDGLVTLYGHMQWNSLRATVGDSVTAGTPLGAEGNTGKSFGCHLHFEVISNGTSVDPQPFMASRGLPLT
jgi:murein DD-endopeptidase MepM/ murein hydrolase activator NlpD